MSADILAIFRRFRSLDPIEQLAAKRELFAWLDGKDEQARDGLEALEAQFALPSAPDGPPSYGTAGRP